MTFPQVDIPSHFSIVNVVEHGQVDSEWEVRVLQACQNEGLIHSRMAENYTAKGLDLENHLTFDALTDNCGNIVSFCGIYNGSRYPSGVYRVLNRTFVTEKYRATQKLFPGLCSRYILPLQMAKFRDTIQFAFVSREGLGGRNFLKRWVTHHAPEPGWQVSNHLIHVAPKGNDQKSFQYIAYKAYASKWQYESISESEWKLLKSK